MLEIHYDTRGEFGIDNLDELLRLFPKMAQRAVNSALSSEGYRLKGALQNAISAGGPAGSKWPAKHPRADIMKRAKTAWINRPKKFTADTQASGSPLLKFKGGIRYKVDKDLSVTSVGFVNPSSGFLNLLEKSEKGFETPVTARMRRFFFGIGQPLAADTRTIKSPARPLVGPVWQAEKNLTLQNLERKFFANLERYRNNPKK